VNARVNIFQVFVKLIFFFSFQNELKSDGDPDLQSDNIQKLLNRWLVL
jgi:hypothetical protein